MTAQHGSTEEKPNMKRIVACAAALLPAGSSILCAASLLACVLAFAVATPALAAEPAGTCAASKFKAAAKRASDKAKCHATALKKGEPVNPECLTKAETRFAAAFTKAESKGGCETTNDAAAIAALVDSTITALVAALPGTPSSSTCAEQFPAQCPNCYDCAKGEGECAALWADCSPDTAPSTACTTFRNCQEACTDLTCLDNCESVHPAGAAAFYAAVQCAGTACTGICSSVCGDNVCNGTEDTTNCKQDCGCGGVCGDGTCNVSCGENAATCAADCTLTGWTCPPQYYNAGDGCECGCGIFDPDCPDATGNSCEWCDDPGSCNNNVPFCGNIDGSDNSKCWR
jgi:hypothetical protein